MNHTSLAKAHCHPRKGPAHLLTEVDINTLLAQLPGWQLDADGKSLRKDFHFSNFHSTLGFINAVGFIANHENHHPDIQAGYSHCQLSWTTHCVGGLSFNDFICAARVDALLAP